MQKSLIPLLGACSAPNHTTFLMRTTNFKHLFIPAFLLEVGLALWVGLILNAPIAWRRYQAIGGGESSVYPIFWELVSVLGLTLTLAFLLPLAGRSVSAVMGALILLISAAAAYYMMAFKVTVGFAVVAAILTLDHSLSAEVVGWKMLLTLLLLGILPAVLWWHFQWRTPSWWRHPQPTRMALPLILSTCASAAISGLAIQMLGHQVQEQMKTTEGAKSSVGAIAHAYVPSNWMVATAMVLHSRAQEARAASELIEPARLFDYRPSVALSDLHVVLVIGETARYDRMGLLGHVRPTTPRLASDPGVAAFRAHSCDTSTKLSLACMFVRQEAVQVRDGDRADLITERNVFSVLKHLGFDIDLYALQSEAGFYSKTSAHFYKLREEILAEPDNTHQSAHDTLLLKELQQAIKRPNPERRPRLTILHTKGSHYLYTNRYPREFAHYTPECPGIDSRCGKQALLNSFDNSILFTDYFLGEVIDLLQDRRALLVYVSDHGETIEDDTHFHATPRRIAPIEQRQVPLIFWASHSWQASPELGPRWQALQQRSRSATVLTEGHFHLYPSMLSCLGIDSSKGGITERLNLCSTANKSPLKP